MALAVRREQTARLIERQVVAQAGEGVGQPPVAAGGEQGRVAGQQRQSQMLRQIDQVAVQTAVVAQAVAGEFDINVFPTETFTSVPPP